MSSHLSWFGNTSWARTRNLRAPPFMATARNMAAHHANVSSGNPPPPGAVVIDMSDLGSPNGEPGKKSETLFGPSIGVVQATPAWTDAPEQKSAADQLTPEIVKDWVTKSKETVHSTTTLQALVNLKRPTIRLSPLESSSDDSAEHHGIEFEYDCDAPKCGIHIHAVLTPDHHLVKKDTPNGTRVPIFETIVDGGFGRVLKLDEGASLELAMYEPRTIEPEDKATTAEESSAGPADSPTDVKTAATAATGEDSRKSRRFTVFRRKNRSAAGPALAVVDVDQSAPEIKSKMDHAADEGVRITIRVVALDQDGNSLSATNEQVTYLQIVRMGAAPESTEEDTRPWVVKVVKREATIGPHTFQLHEIFGLSSHSTAPTAPVAPTLDESHSYPPANAAPHVEDEPSSECLVCLSSPREVVLLPCRHLVACRECAVNMVEFGAGGNIVHTEEPTAGEPSTVDPADPNAATNATTQPTEPAATPTFVAPLATAGRRKRRAKGWFCPVCRQPYTSLLRISLASGEVDGKLDSASSKEESPAPAPAIQTPAAPAPAETRTGLLSTIKPPAFLRSLSRGSAQGVNPAAENQV